MRLNKDDFLKLLKVKDLHALAKSIFDIMVGKSEEMGKIEETQKKVSDKTQFKPSSMMGGISLDLIPLNWVKMPETQEVFRILGLCFTPIKDQISSSTHQIFDEIHSIASNAYKINFGQEDWLESNYCFKTDKLSQDYINRLQSVVYNNQAVSMFLNITDQTCTDTQSKIAQKVMKLINQSLRICPQNQVALLNKALL